MLVCPSGRDFFYILEFLFRQIDPLFSFKDAKKPEEETPALFKFFRYPFAMSSRSLYSVGTRHSWPTFLAAVHWIIELLTYDESAELEYSRIASDDFLSPEALRFSFFEFISQAYHAFMSANDDLENELESQFLQTLLDRNAERQDMMTRKQEHRVEIEKEIERIENHESRLHVLKEKIDSSERDVVKFQEYVKGLNESKAQTAYKLEEAKKLSSTEMQIVEMLQKEIETLEERLQFQLERNLDVDKINQEVKELDKSIEMAVSHRDDLEKASWNIEMEISKRFNDIQKNVFTFNQHIRSTGLSNQITSELRINPQSSPMLSIDLKKSAKPILKENLEVYKKQHEENQSTLVETQTKSEQIQDELVSKRKQYSDLNSKLTHENSTFQKLKESLDIDLQSTDHQISQIQNEIEELLSSDKKTLIIKEQANQELLRILEEKKIQYKTEKTQLYEMVDQIINWSVSHKEYISDKLLILKQNLEGQAEAAS